MPKILLITVLLMFASGCAQTTTKRLAYPDMYGNGKPVTILVIPAINESTAADAGDFLNVTVTQPFSNQGYYVLPMPIVTDIFQREGIIEGTQAQGIPTSLFRENFGADAVLFMTIESWDKNYIVIGGNVTVGIEYVLLSTNTNEVLWSYEQQIVVDTSGSSGNILADLITTAVVTGVTDYVPVAFSVHAAAMKAMPFGGYHPRSGADGEVKSVNIDAQAGALDPMN